MAVNEKYPVRNRDNLTIPIQMQLSLKEKGFSQFFAAFLKSRLNFEHFEKKKMTLAALVFPKLRTPKTWLDKCLKSHVSEDPSTRNMVKVLKQCWSLHHRPFFIFIDHCEGNWIGKSLSIPIQMQLYQKEKTLSKAFAAYFKSRLNFKIFEKKDDPQRFFFFGSYALRKCSQINV